MIKELTPEQIAKFPEYVEKFTKLGLSTEPFTENSKVEIKKIMNKVYKAGGLKAPKYLIYLDSPLACLYGFMYFKKLMEILNKTAIAQTQVRSQVESQVRSQVWSEFYNFCYGSHSAASLAYYAYFLHEVGITSAKKMQPSTDLAGKCSWFLPYENVVFVSQNPTKISMIEGRLHNEKGMAVEYADGFGSYSLRGILMPEWVLKTPKTELDAKAILRIENVDQRREAMRHYGLDRLVEHLNKKVIDKKDGYELIEMDITEGETGRFLQMKNPSIDAIHIEGVPDTVRTVEEALYFRNQNILKAIGYEKWIAPKQLT